MIRPGVDRSVFNIDQDKENVNRVLLKNPGLKQTFVLYVGRIAVAKNLDILINSFELINDLKLVIVGDGPYLLF